MKSMLLTLTIIIADNFDKGIIKKYLIHFIVITNKYINKTHFF